MIWFLAGVVPPILWATVNHIDKYLLSKTKHHSTVDVLMVYSTFFSVLVLPFLLYFGAVDLFMSPTQVVVQVVGGLLLTASVYFYLLALNRDEASVVIPFALLTPVFGYVLSIVFLDENLSSLQIISCILILFGALILTLEFEEERRVRIRHAVLGFMIACTGLQAVQEVMFKFVTIENSFVASIFWLHVGILIYGLFLVGFRKGLFSKFLHSVQLNGRTIFSLSVVSELINAIAYMVRNYALLLAPVAIIMTLNGYQPAFVFILGILMTIFTPHLGVEKIRLIHLVHKGSAIAIMVIGTVLISRTL